MAETSPELRLMVVALQELAIWIVAGVATLALRRRPELERLPLRLALVLSLVAGGVLALGWTPSTSPSMVNRVVAQTPPVMQALLEEEQASQGLQWSHLLWAIVASGLVVRLGWQCVRSWRVARRAEPLTALPAEATTGHGWWPSIRRSDTIAAPATIGNVIVLPRNWTELQLRAVRALLQHERGHVARGDFWWTLLSKLHLALFWWNPCAWWADRRLSYLAECLSDDDVLSNGHRRTDYAELLLHYLRGAPPASVGLSAANSMRQRLDRILSRPDTWQRTSPRRLVVAGLLFAATSSLSMPVLWAAGAATEFSVPLRFVLVRGGGRDVLASGSTEDVDRALAAAGATKQPVLWYARGSHVRVTNEACVITEIEAIHHAARAASPGRAVASSRLARTGPERRTFWLIRKLNQS